jgi:hypothetical protein
MGWLEKVGWGVGGGTIANIGGGVVGGAEEGGGGGRRCRRG